MNNVTPSLRFPEYRLEWGFEELYDICSKLNVGFVGTCDPYYTTPSQGVLMLRTGNLKSYGLDLNKVKHVTREFHDKNKKSQVNSGDILVARHGSNGQAILVEKNITEANCLNIVIIRPFKEIDSEFLTFQFNSPKLSRQIARKTAGSTQGVINTKELYRLKFSIPTQSSEQQKIADFLSAVDKKTSLLKEKHNLLEQYKKGVMQKLFSQEIRFKDEDGNDFADWQEKSLSQVLEIQVREIPKPTEKYLALGIRSHMKGTFQKPNFDPEAIMMDKLFIVRPNDLIVNITFAWEGAIAIAKNDDDGGLVSHRFPTYTFKEGESTHRYFKHIIMLKRFKYMLDLISPGGAGRNRVLSKKEFLKLKWNLPSVEEQLKIADFLDALDKKAELLSDQIEQTQTFKKGLLQQMFV